MSNQLLVTTSKRTRMTAENVYKNIYFRLQAFERVKSEADITEGKLIFITEEYFDAALEFARDSFTRDEPINHAVNTQWFPGLGEMWLATFRCHLTLAVLNEEDKIIALRGTRVLDKNATFDATQFDDPGFNILFGIMDHCDAKADFFNRFDVDTAFQMFGFGVHRDYRNRGLGSRIFKAAMSLLKYAGPDSFCIKGETSSFYSSRIYEKNGFELLYQLSYDDWLVDGKQVICNTGVHKNMKIYGLRMNKIKT